jgi:hypothetical protein
LTQSCHPHDLTQLWALSASFDLHNQSRLSKGGSEVSETLVHDIFWSLRSCCAEVRHAEAQSSWFHVSVIIVNLSHRCFPTTQDMTVLAPATRPEDGPRVWMDISVDDQPRGRIEVGVDTLCKSEGTGGLAVCV